MKNVDTRPHGSCKVWATNARSSRALRSMVSPCTYVSFVTGSYYNVYLILYFVGIKNAVRKNTHSGENLYVQIILVGYNFKDE